MNRFSPYEYLGFIVPGGLVITVAYYGLYGMPEPEPGVTVLVGLVGAAFLTGHLVAAIANVLAPIAWGRRPGNDPPSHEGLFDKHGYLAATSPDETLSVFDDRLGKQDNLSAAFKAGAKRMRDAGRGAQLHVFNQQIGFYRNTATGSLLSFLLVGGYAAFGNGPQPLPFTVWGPVFALATWLFTSRYKRFWRYYGREVWLDVRNHGPSQQGTTGQGSP